MPCPQAQTGTVRAGPWTSGQWCYYYHRNAERPLPLPWLRGAELSEAERGAVAGSLQDFQLGESSEGRHLLHRAEQYAERADDPEYLEAMQLFVREEQRHARLLGRFLHLAGIEPLRRSRLDTAFRLLRRLAGLVLSITVLLIAETIGKVYYRALRRATSSPLLRRICDQLLRDEVRHMHFHAERLAIVRRGRARWRIWLAHAAHRFLYGGTCLLVWLKHRRALRAGGLTFLGFWRECRQELRGTLRIMDPRGYRWARAQTRYEVPFVYERIHG
jgi:hypothetical protein